VASSPCFSGTGAPASVAADLADRRPQRLPVDDVRRGDLVVERVGIGLLQLAVPHDAGQPQVEEEPGDGLLETHPDAPLTAEQHGREHDERDVAVEGVEEVVEDLGRGVQRPLGVDLAVTHGHDDGADDGTDLDDEVPPERVVPARIVRQVARDRQQDRRADGQEQNAGEEPVELTLTQRQEPGLEDRGDDHHGQRRQQQEEQQVHDEPVPAQPRGVPEEPDRVVEPGEIGGLH